VTGLEVRIAECNILLKIYLAEISVEPISEGGFEALVIYIGRTTF